MTNTTKSTGALGGAPGLDSDLLAAARDVAERLAPDAGTSKGRKRSEWRCAFDREIDARNITCRSGSSNDYSVIVQVVERRGTAGLLLDRRVLDRYARLWFARWRAHARSRRGAEQDAAKRRAAGDVVAGVDVRVAFNALRQREPFAGKLGRTKLSIGHGTHGACSGHQSPSRNRIRITAGPLATSADILETLVHEMTHAVCPDSEGHGERFRRTLRRASLELWGIDVPIDGIEARHGKIAYAMDDLIRTELAVRIAAGSVETFPPKPIAAPAPAPKPSRAELSAELVERRAKRAVATLERAEKRLKNAERAVAKWRQKVRYYERRAACRRKNDV